MNLLLFTVELERSRPVSLAPGQPARRNGRFKWVAITAGALLCTVATALAGWIIAGGDNDLLSGGIGSFLPISTASAATGSEDSARVEIISEPANATLLLDGHKQGQTPVSVSIPTGRHTLLLTHPDAIDNQRQVTVTGDTRFDANMLLRHPVATLVKPAYPGANITAANFLADGRLGLLMADRIDGSNGNSRPASAAWVFDPRGGSLLPFINAANPRSTVLTLSPDGTAVAYGRAAAADAKGGPGVEHLTEVVVARADGSAAAVPFSLPRADSNSANTQEREEVHDIAWTPDGHNLLVAVRLYALSGGTPAGSRTRLMLVSADPADVARPPVELVTLPAEVVAASYTWSADGAWVAFLTEASNGTGGAAFVALCALDTRAGGSVSGFRYVADLQRLSGGLAPLPVAPVAWSPTMDGRLVFAGPTPKLTVSNPLGLPTTSGGEPGLFLTTPTLPGLSAEEGKRLGTGTGLMAPAWDSATVTGDIELVALARSAQGSKPLTLRGVDPVTGQLRNLDVVLPSGVGGSGSVGARWDLAHGQVMVLAPHDTSNSGSLDYWLLQLREPNGAHS